MHKIELKDKRTEEERKGQPTVGANCEILLDGKPLEGVRSFKLEVDAGGVAKATIEMYGDFSAWVLGDYEQKVYQIKRPNQKEDNHGK